MRLAGFSWQIPCPSISGVIPIRSTKVRRPVPMAGSANAVPIPPAPRSVRLGWKASWGYRAIGPGICR